MAKGQPNKDLTGLRVGLLSVIRWVGQHPVSGNYEWLCQCDCGNETIVRGQYLTSSRTYSCGCMQGNHLKNKPEMPARSYLFTIHNNIIARCYNPNNKRYRSFGGKGIKFYEPWLKSAQTFIDDVLEEIGPKPSREYIFDRIDTTKDFEPGNIRWSTFRDTKLNSQASRTAKHYMQLPNGLYFVQYAGQRAYVRTEKQAKKKIREIRKKLGLVKHLRDTMHQPIKDE